MGNKAIALIFVALMLCSVFSGVVSAAGTSRDLAVGAVLDGNRIRISVWDNNHPGAVEAVFIEVVNKDNGKVHMSKKVKGTLESRYYCEIKEERLSSSGPNTLIVRVSGLYDSSKDPKKSNNKKEIVFIKKQDIKITRLESKEENGGLYVRAGFIVLNKDPQQVDLAIAQNLRYIVYARTYYPKELKTNTEILTPWIPVTIDKKRTAQALQVECIPQYGDKSPNDNSMAIAVKTPK